jgi:hypothetical protein
MMKRKGCSKKLSAREGLLGVPFSCTKQMVGFYFAAAGAFAGLVGAAFPKVSRYASGVAFCCTGFSVWLAHNNSGNQ